MAFHGLAATGAALGEGYAAGKALEGWRGIRRKWDS